MRILFIVGPALGHIGRALVVARQLRKLGNADIAFSCPARPNGMHTRLLAPEFPVIELPANNPGGFDIGFAEALERVMADFSADLIVCDLSPLPWLPLIRFPQTPRAYLTNVFLTALGSRKTVQDSLWEQHGTRWNSLRQRRGLPPLDSARQFYDTDLVLLADPAAVIATCPPPPPSFRAVGPCSWEPEGELPPELAAEQDLLLLSMGSTGHELIPEAVVHQLAQITGASRSVFVGTADSGYSREILHCRWVPGSKLLRHSRFAVTQGGTGSAYQALANGVPVGCIPTHQNHRILGQVLEDIHAGQLFEQDDWPRQFTVLENALAKLQGSANGISTDLHQSDGPLRAAEAILNHLQANDPLPNPS